MTNRRHNDGGKIIAVLLADVFYLVQIVVMKLNDIFIELFGNSTLHFDTPVMPR